MEDLEKQNKEIPRLVNHVKELVAQTVQLSFKLQELTTERVEMSKLLPQLQESENKRSGAYY